MTKTGTNKKRKKSSRFPSPRWWPLAIAKAIVWPSFTLFFRTKIYYEGGKKASRPRGKAIIVANHPSIWEPPVLLHAFFYRNLRFLTNRTVFENNKLLAFILHMAGCIDIDKEHFEISSIRHVTEALQNDQVVCIFPEGALSETGELLPFKSGVVMMALQSGAPVLPVYIKKTEKLWQRKKMIVGLPIDIGACLSGKHPSMRQIDAVAAQLQARVGQLKEQLDRCETGVPLAQNEPFRVPGRAEQFSEE